MIKANLIGFNDEQSIETIRVANPEELKTHVEKMFEGRAVDIANPSHSSNIYDVKVDGQKRGEIEVIPE